MLGLFKLSIDSQALASHYTDHQHYGVASRLSHGKQCGEVTRGEMNVVKSLIFRLHAHL